MNIIGSQYVCLADALEVAIKIMKNHIT